MTDSEWAECLHRLDEHEQHILAWEPDTPNPTALRCVHSRHRTLAHLRACQETWLSVVEALLAKPGAKVKALHPWRLFEQKGYATHAWDEHMAAFLADRKQLMVTLRAADRSIGGKFNGNDCTIENLISGRMVAHEHHHLFTPR